MLPCRVATRRYRQFLTKIRVAKIRCGPTSPESRQATIQKPVVLTNYRDALDKNRDVFGRSSAGNSVAGENRRETDGMPGGVFVVHLSFIRKLKLLGLG